MSVISLTDYFEAMDCPELINAYDINPPDDWYQDKMDAHTYSLFLAYGDTCGN